ncbi:succinate dehydrogenase assembly factor 2 [Falsirhodobacter sp. 20TX0035]|uniref:succinate dehydrogenase assembly factor 2 n=1 Tax=Falsirhodobacter sp. 20TX0035 TaxID=3022019 RepID=UPI00232E2532|nr:succinate dehydrogenase assembly factor 2 [Falsirhodobacter sp. 20TX0035]MDB6453663.1 succinate dehydrogenase assembly factor 2 [Falsirhodobacter sp. 20TX0035]
MNDVLKRLRMRSWRRGMKEMDLILGPWADQHLADLSEDTVAIYDKILLENDQDLLAWMLGQREIPEGPMKPLLAQIAIFARERFRGA